MAKKSVPEDPNQNAARVVALTTGQDIPTDVLSENEKLKRLRSEAASILGKMGGSKGGFARAAKLSKEKQSEIGRKAAAARWKTHI
jgi:hypothetical protein